YQKQEDDPELLNCAELLESFTKQCRDILSIKNGEPIICHADPDTSVFLSRDRFEFMMLCLLIDLHKDSDDIHQINVYARNCNDTVSIVLSLTPVGEAQELPHFISEFTPLHKGSPSFTTERMIIDAFCRRYNAALMRNKQGDSMAYCLRIPAADISQGMELHSYKPEKEKQIITPYHAMLYDISDFRYY
ncbi:MAG: hypothetical protein IJY74_04990, partial [Oscillospiraceae bacterium]|nr:hypothetical protein [Oscillospiraceae bacterium]